MTAEWNLNDVPKLKLKTMGHAVGKQRPNGSVDGDFDEVQRWLISASTARILGARSGRFSPK